MLRSDLATRIALLNPGLPADIANDLVKAFFETMAATLEEHGRIELRGFATFSIARPITGATRNPATGRPTVGNHRCRIRFKTSRTLSDALTCK